MQIIQGHFPFRHNFCHFWRDYYLPFFCLTKGQPARLTEYATNNQKPWLLPEQIRYLFTDHFISDQRAIPTMLPIPTISDLEALRDFVLSRNQVIRWSDGTLDRRIVVIERNSRRELSNRMSLVQELRRAGHNVVSLQLERFTFPEQLRQLQSATHLIGYHGAGIVQGLFCPPDCKIIEILPPGWRYDGFHALLAHRRYVQLPSEPGEQVVPSEHTHKYRDICGNVEIPRILELCKKS